MSQGKEKPGNASRIDEKASPSSSSVPRGSLYTPDAKTRSTGLYVENGGIAWGTPSSETWDGMFQAEEADLGSMDFRTLVSHFMGRLGMSAREIGRRGVSERHLFEHPHKDWMLRRLARVLCLDKAEESELMRAAADFRKKYEEYKSGLGKR